MWVSRLLPLSSACSQSTVALQAWAGSRTMLHSILKHVSRVLESLQTSRVPTPYLAHLDRALLSQPAQDYIDSSLPAVLMSFVDLATCIECWVRFVTGLGIDYPRNSIATSKAPEVR